MPTSLCDGAHGLDFSNACVRSAWATLPAFIFVACILLLAPVTRILPKSFTDIFKTYLTLHEAEALNLAASSESEREVEVKAVVPLWRTVVFALVGLAEALSWFSIGAFTLKSSSPVTFLPILSAITWLYTVIRAATRPSVTPLYDTFVVCVLQLFGGFVLLGGALWNRHTAQNGDLVWVYSTNIVMIIVLLAVVMTMPMEVPSDRVNKADIGKRVTPEDYTTLFGWLSFSWVQPLVESGRDVTLNDEDVWDLSPTIQTRPIFLKFNNIKQPSLLRQLWVANSLDILLDAAMSITSVIFNYSIPFFMSLILSAMDEPHPNPTTRGKAYIYAILMFVCTVIKAESDLQHLYFVRRGATRLRSELMAAIYNKALKRKDLSGVVNKDDTKVEEANKKPDHPNAKKVDKKDKKKDDEDEPKAGADVGKIVTLMAGDANKIASMLVGLTFLYGAPLELAIGGFFLYQLLGWSAFSGFIVLVLCWPLNSMLSKRSVRIQKGTMSARDKRMGVLNELIGAVKFIKFFAWEDKWIEKTMAARNVEIGWMVKSRINSTAFYALWTTAPVLLSIVSFFTYVMQGNELTISKAFTAISLFSMIRTPLNIIPVYIVQILQTRVSLKRIEVYLGEDEVDGQVSSLKAPNSPTALTEDNVGLGLKDATCRWNEVVEKKTDERTMSVSVETDEPDPSQGDHKFELADISVIFPEGELTVITGPTASGKTALLMALLGEMTLVSGRLLLAKNPSNVDEHGNMQAVSYAAQSPWLRHQSIKDNILFGYPFDEERYTEVLEACALKPDLEQLEDGDETEIGAKGVSLSGGQKARVALARAVYSRTRYVLLDDPLSAVDSHTARHLFESLLTGHLLKHRTVILVTHHVELVLPGAGYLVRMLDGRIDIQGRVEDLKLQGKIEGIVVSEEAEFKEDAQNASKEEDAETVALEGMTTPDVEGDAAVVDLDVLKKKPRKLVKDEHRETGGVKWNIYKKYLQASSYTIWSILFFLVVLSEGLGIGEKIWIKIWGEAYGAEIETVSASFLGPAAHGHDCLSRISLHHHSPNHISAALTAQFEVPSGFTLSRPVFPDARQNPLFYVSIYAAIGLAAALVNVLSSAAQYTGALRASKALFKQLLVTVVRATFRFHDTTPQGRMLNRFGKDVETIDSSLAGSMQAVNSTLGAFFVSIITVAVVVPPFLVPAILLGIIYRSLSVAYLSTGRDLRRMESNTRSPIFSDFGEILEGIVTVRAFSAEKRFLNGLFTKVDQTTKMWYGFWMTNRWLLFNFDVLGAVGVFFTCMFSISTLPSAGLAGLCITSALSFTMNVYWACRFWTGLELDLNSVERIVEYLDLPQEPPAQIPTNRPPAYWPSSSASPLLSVENLTIKYAPDLPSVLHDVSFCLRSGERVGLLGRTGSGKSTLAMSLMRFVDPTEGRIVIDGIDVSGIGVGDLRERITFIPQDATLFSGTLRENLDPFGDHEDQDCWEALYRVQMVHTRDMPLPTDTPGTSRPGSIHETSSPSDSAVHGRDDSISTEESTIIFSADSKTSVSLQTKVSPGGTNFSQGQRQLIAMARALLRRSSIIILDEATSSIDFKTDTKIQKVIREEFGGNLLLTVAHRLRTVIDYDRLLVLDKGKVAEFDTPWELIQKESGIFRGMCLRSGTFAELEEAAKRKAEGKSEGPALGE